MTELSYKEVGQRIRFLRESADYTRDALAEKLDISSKFLYEMEVGKKGFSIEILYRIGGAFSVSTDYLLTGREDGELPGNIYDLLACFEPEQMGTVEEMLILLHNIYHVKQAGATD